MISAFKTWLFGRDDAPGDADELPLAAAALLVEAASLDEDFSERERQTIIVLLEERFGLTPEAARALVDRASTAVAESTQLYGFTRTIKDRLQPEERIRIIEMLWEVAYADGRIDSYEAGLVRRVAGLLFVPDKESGAARLRVLARLDSKDTSLK
jgi:uncharacterized tellurite resistance protein B-like protein